MLLHIYFFLVIVFFNEVKASFNPDPTYKNAGMQNVNGTTAQISDDQSMIGAGFADGTFKIFDIQVNQLCSNVSTANQSITGSVWMPNFGPVTVDNSGKVIIWSTQCQITSQMTLSDPIYGIGYFQSVDNTTGNTTGLIALNFGQWIQQYDVINFTQLTKYQADNNDVFTDFLYYNDGENDMLIASTQGSRIRVMNIEDGSQSDSFDVASKILMMSNFQGTSGNQVLGLGQDNKIYRFTSAGGPFQLGDFTSSNSIAFCPSTKQFALAWKQIQSIGVYLSSGNQQKSLVSLQGISQQIDCSNTYLISIDDKGYINVYTYEQFKTWIIGVIVGILGGLLLLLIGVIVFIRLRRKWARQAQQEKTYSNKPKKYPRNVNKKMQKIDSMNMLQNVTLQTTMRQ